MQYRHVFVVDHGVDHDDAKVLAEVALLFAGGSLGAETLRAAQPQFVAREDALVAKPIDGPRDIHYRGDSQGVLTAIAASYRLSVLVDDNCPNRHVRFELDNATFATAMQLASAVTKFTQ